MNNKQMNIPERQKEELLLFHQQFLQSPIASSIKKLLEKHESNIVTFLAATAMDITGTTDQQLRHYAVQLAETRKLVKTIFDSETFLNKTINEKQ
jgi:hypothetical protein